MPLKITSGQAEIKETKEINALDPPVNIYDRSDNRNYQIQESIRRQRSRGVRFYQVETNSKVAEGTDLYYAMHSPTVPDYRLDVVFREWEMWVIKGMQIHGNLYTPDDLIIRCHFDDPDILKTTFRHLCSRAARHSIAHEVKPLIGEGKKITVKVARISVMDGNVVILHVDSFQMEEYQDAREDGELSV